MKIAKSGFYAQGSSLLAVHVKDDLLSVCDTSENRWYTWTSLPSDCVYLHWNYADSAVQAFVKANPQA